MSADFENELLEGDRDNDGISAVELQRNLGLLTQIAARDAGTQQRAEKAFLSTVGALMRQNPSVKISYRIEDGELVVQIPKGTNTQEIRFPHRAPDVSSFPQVLAKIGEHNVELG